MPAIKKAFTLIELLVVIAIIAILAAILFPVFAQARESARTTSCLSNVKQIALGLTMYTQDFDERVPMWYYDMTPDNPLYGKTDPDGGGYKDYHVGWDKMVAPYLKNRAIFHCPDRFGPGNDWSDPTKDSSGWTGTQNYAVNARLVGRAGESWLVPSKLASVNWPATSILLVEDGTQTSTGSCMADSGLEWGWTGDHKSNLVAEGADGVQPGPLVQHKGGSNYGFADGHAKWLNGHAMGLLSNGTATDQSVLAAGLDYTGNHATYHINPGN